ncbi:MAG: hypothetical protein Kow00102_07370 [Spirochaetota bacterium]
MLMNETLQYVNSISSRDVIARSSATPREMIAGGQKGRERSIVNTQDSMGNTT